MKGFSEDLRLKINYLVFLTSIADPKSLGPLSKEFANYEAAY